MTDMTQILNAIEEGDPSAAEQLLPLVYDELRKLAAAKLANEQPGQTLQATELVHEAFLRLHKSESSQPGEGSKWDGRGHFFGAAAESMRRILVENARRKQSLKRGGDRQRLDLQIESPALPVRTDQLLALDEALDRLAELDPDKARLVKLRFFAGLSIGQAAKALGVSITTANRWWAYARAWLHAEIRPDDQTTNEV